MSENVLTIENATMQFGGVVAVDNLNLKVDKDQIVSLIGPNGAGKTTAFNVVTGVYAPTNGAVWFEGRKIIENTPHGKMKKLYKGQNASKYSHIIAPTPDKITQMGIARTFQNIRLWKSQTVFENVLIAKHLRRSSKLKMEVSLDEPLNIDWDGNELLLSDILGTDNDLVCRDIEDEVDKELLNIAMNRLNPREKRIMELRFGLGGRSELTQKQVADMMGISQSYISRLEKHILKTLKREMQQMSGI